MSIGISMKALKKILFVQSLEQEARLGTSNVIPSAESFADDIKDFELASGDSTAVKHLHVGRVCPGNAETVILPYLNETLGDETVSLGHKIDVVSKFSYTDKDGKVYYRVRLDTTQVKKIDGDAQGRNFLEKSPVSKWVWTSSLLPVPEEVELEGEEIVHNPHTQYVVKSGHVLVLHPTLDPNIGETHVLTEGTRCSVAKEKRNPDELGDSPLFCTVMVDGVEYNVEGRLFDDATEIVRIGLALAILTDEDTGEKSILPVNLRSSFIEGGVKKYICQYPVNADGDPIYEGYNKIGTPEVQIATIVVPESDLAVAMADFVADESDKPRGLVMDDSDLNSDGEIGDLAIRLKAFSHGDDIYYECLSYNEDREGNLIIAPERPVDNDDFVDGAYFVKASDILSAHELIAWLEGDKRAVCLGIGTAEEQAAAWNASIANGGLKKYYDKYPEEDMWDTTTNAPGNWNNVGSTFTSYDMEGNELATGKAVKVWEDGNGADTFLKVRVVENSVDGWVGRFFYVQGNATIGDEFYELFTDKDLTESANIKVKLNKKVLVNAEHNMLGAIYASGALYPWIVLNFDEDVNARVKLTYINPANDESISISPWGDKVFHKGFGCVSLPREFSGIITATNYRLDIKDGSIITPSNFVPENLSIELLRD